MPIRVDIIGKEQARILQEPEFDFRCQFEDTIDRRSRKSPVSVF